MSDSFDKWVKARNESTAMWGKTLSGVQTSKTEEIVAQINADAAQQRNMMITIGILGIAAAYILINSEKK